MPAEVDPPLPSGLQDQQTPGKGDRPARPFGMICVTIFVLGVAWIAFMGVPAWRRAGVPDAYYYSREELMGRQLMAIADIMISLVVNLICFRGLFIEGYRRFFGAGLILSPTPWLLWIGFFGAHPLL